MGDPVTMAMIGAGVGAITNPRKPLQGALLGGALGGFGGAAMGAGNAAATATMTGATMPTVGTGVAASKPIASFGTGAFATPTMPTYAATGGSTGLIGSATAPVTMMDRFKALGQFNRENPMVGQVGSSAFQSLNQPQPMAAAMQPGLLRGTPSPEQQQMAMFQQPQISLI